jgi:hypothetical protein
MPVSFRRTGLVATGLALAASLILTLPMRPGGAASTAAIGAQGIDPAWKYCRAEIAKVERAQSIPAHLLAAISVVESGRQAPGSGKARGEISAWPWTVMAEGKGRYLPSKAAAIAEVEKLRARGVRNIDVGCMQVNLQYHPDAFADLEEAFDPAANVAYAAEFLTRLRQDKGSWSKAVAHYHSATPARHVVYRAKVFAAWRDERRRAARADYATDVAQAEATLETPVAEATLVTVPPVPAVPADESMLLGALAFGRAGPVEPSLQAGTASGAQLGMASAPLLGELQPGG